MAGTLFQYRILLWRLLNSHVCIYIYITKSVYMCICVYTGIQIQMHVHEFYVPVHTCYMYVDTYVHMHTYIHVCIYMHVYIYIDRWHPCPRGLREIRMVAHEGGAPRIGRRRYGAKVRRGDLWAPATSLLAPCIISRSSTFFDLRNILQLRAFGRSGPFRSFIGDQWTPLPCTPQSFSRHLDKEHISKTRRGVPGSGDPLGV